MDYGTLNWATFPERLEDHGISWKHYQNEIAIDTGFEGEEDPGYQTFRIIRWSFLASIILSCMIST
jgi:phospholipase C